MGRDVGHWEDGNSTCSRESEISSKFLQLPAQYSIKYCRISTGSSWENPNENDGKTDEICFLKMFGFFYYAYLVFRIFLFFFEGTLTI